MANSKDVVFYASVLVAEAKQVSKEYGLSFDQAMTVVVAVHNEETINYLTETLRAAIDEVGSVINAVG